MENVIYQRTLMVTRLAEDGETPTILYLTKEVNGYAVIIDSFDGVQLVQWVPAYKGQSHAIERAVTLVEQYKSNKGAV